MIYDKVFTGGYLLLYKYDSNVINLLWFLNIDQNNLNLNIILTVQ